jgi:uncharacterized protein (DUF1697 family)
MKKLKLIFERLGFTEVSTYINSGNVIFKSGKTKNVILCEIKQILKKEFDFEIPVLVKTEKEIKKNSGRHSKKLAKRQTAENRHSLFV